MADNDSLLAAICAPPADDGARLAYSDWLEEHGDAERAEFIRVQCALARLPKRASQAADLRRRQRVLLAANRAEWLGPLKGVAKSLDFQRGFVDCARLSAAELFQHAEALFRHAPLSCLSVREIKAEHTAPLAALPLLGRVRTLRLGTYSTGIGRKGAGPGLAAALASSRHLGNLEELSLDLCGIGVEGARALEAASRLKSLRVLSLVGNWIGAALGRALAAAPFLRHIATLDLSSNNLGGKGLAQLVRSNRLGPLVELVLAFDDIDDQGTAALAECRRLSQLTTLHLYYNQIGPAGAAALAASPHLAGLTTLKLSNNGIHDRGAIALAESPYLEQIKSLEVYSCFLRDEGKAALRRRFGKRVQF